ncbi:MAG: FlgO family outer membrane protein [Candidatus Desulfaltia sp.]|nr:FlgO family outer membrane protein [Candidatus Desulfaltia sp.]
MKKFRRFIIVCVLSTIFFFSGFQYSIAYENEIKDLSSVMTVNIANAGKKTVAVVDFTDLQGNVTELGRFLAEEFSVALAGSGKGFEVVDRTHLKSIITEHKLSATGLIDPQTARKLGKIAGVEALITGTITPFGDSIRLSVKVLDTETAKMISASSGNIARTKAIEELLARGIEVATASGGRPIAMRSAPPSAGKTVEAEGFIFRPVGCKRTGEKVVCTVSFINNGNEERDLQLYSRGQSRSYLYDNHGNQYPVFVQIGHQIAKLECTTSMYVEQKFISQLPVNVSFIADGVKSDATHMTAAIGIKQFKKSVAVRNIPITK